MNRQIQQDGCAASFEARGSDEEMFYLSYLKCLVHKKKNILLKLILIEVSKKVKVSYRFTFVTFILKRDNTH